MAIAGGKANSEPYARFTDWDEYLAHSLTTPPHPAVLVLTCLIAISAFFASSLLQGTHSIPAPGTMAPPSTLCQPCSSTATETHGQLEARVADLAMLVSALEKGKLAAEAAHNATVATLVARVASLHEEAKAAADAAEEALEAAVEAVTHDAAKAAEAAATQEEEEESYDKTARPCTVAEEAAKYTGGVEVSLKNGDAKAVSITMTPALCFRADANAWRTDYKEWPTPVDFLEGTHNLRSFTITFWMKTDEGCPQARMNEHWFDGCGLITTSPPGPPSWTWSDKVREQRCVGHNCASIPGTCAEAGPF